MPAALPISRPPSGAQINWGHPLTVGLVSAHLINGSRSSYDLVNGHSGDLTNTNAPQYRGSFIYFNSTSNNYYRQNQGPDITGKQFTFTTGSSFITAGGNGCTISMNSSGVSNQTPGIRYSATTSILFFLFFNDLTATIPDVSTGRFSVASGIVRANQNMEAWEGGILRNTKTSSGVSTYISSDRTLWIGGSDTVGGVGTHAGHFAYVHGRDLSPNEIQWLHAEPYSILLTPVARKYFIPGLVPPPANDGVACLFQPSQVVRQEIKVIPY